MACSVLGSRPQIILLHKVSESGLVVQQHTLQNHSLLCVIPLADTLVLPPDNPTRIIGINVSLDFRPIATILFDDHPDQFTDCLLPLFCLGCAVSPIVLQQ